MENKELELRYKEVCSRIQKAAERCKSQNTPTLVAVGKKKPVELLYQLYLLGHRDFGENYVQELVEKANWFKQKEITDIRFHLIGHLQTNKIKTVIPHVHTIQSVDSERCLIEIEKRANEANKIIHVFIQVNIDNEESKSGFKVDQLKEVALKISTCSFVKSQGLMAIPDPEQPVEMAFQRLVECSRMNPCLGTGLSMGMSHDFEQAIEKGSTCVRVGTAIFGER